MEVGGEGGRGPGSQLWFIYHSTVVVGAKPVSEFRSCVKIEAAVLMSLTVSVDVKQH